jgi:hypothetical protein
VFDLYGNTLLESDGIPICPEPECTYDKNQEWIDACYDGDHGAFVAWEDRRDSTPSERQIFAQRINSDGILHWDLAGVRVCPSDRHQYNPQIVGDETGGAVVAWSELTQYYDNKLMAAKLDHEGNTVWWVEAANDIEGTLADDILEDIAPDGTGGAYICYNNLNPFEPYDINLYAQRVDPTGSTLWGEDGITICDLPEHQRNCRVVGLEDNGTIFVWEDLRNENDYDIYALRVSPDGIILWEEDGIVICDEVNDQCEFDLVKDEDGYIYIVWEDFRNGLHLDLYVQKLDLDGNLHYPAGGLAVCTADYYQMDARIVGDGQGGNFIAWTDYRVGVSADLYCTHLDADGNLSSQTLPGWSGQWEANGNILASAYNRQEHCRLVKDGESGFLAIWENRVIILDDAGECPGYEEVLNLFAQRVNDNVVGIKPGTGVEAPTALRLYQSYPNPFNPSTVISYQLPVNSFVTLTVYDISGRLVTELVKGWREAGEHELTFDGRDLASGMYLYRIDAGDFNAVRKMVLVK